jgi:NCS1 family nucleobase:cation symporter-1
MNSGEHATRLEIRTIQPIALDARHGRAQDLFTVWFGSNVQLC